MPLSQSLYWRPPADQKASGPWVRDCIRTRQHGIINNSQFVVFDHVDDVK